MPEASEAPPRRVFVVRMPIARFGGPAFVPPDLVVVDTALEDGCAHSVALEKLSHCLNVDRDTATQIFQLEFLS